MESWQQLLRKQSIASLEALVARFGAEHFPDLDRLRQAAEDLNSVSPRWWTSSPADPSGVDTGPTCRSSSATDCRDAAVPEAPHSSPVAGRTSPHLARHNHVADRRCSSMCAADSLRRIFPLRTAAGACRAGKMPQAQPRRDYEEHVAAT